MSKNITLTEDKLLEIQLEWYERGKRQAQKELRTELAKILGLYDLFETRVEED